MMGAKGRGLGIGYDWHDLWICKGWQGFWAAGNWDGWMMSWVHLFGLFGVAAVSCLLLEIWCH